MTLRPFPKLLVGLLATAALLAGCASPDESGSGGTSGTPGDEQATGCGPDVGGEAGHEDGTTGSGTGDITTADGGDPSRPTASVCPTDGTTATGDDRASTGLGEPGGGFSTAPEG